MLLLRSSCTHAAAHTPAETTGLSRSRPLAVPVAGSLPRYNGGSASASTFSRPARRSLALRPACSLNRPRRSVSPKCFSPFRYLHDPLRLLPAGTNKLPGGIRTRWSAVPWHGARSTFACGQHAAQGCVQCGDVGPKCGDVGPDRRERLSHLGLHRLNSRIESIHATVCPVLSSSLFRRDLSDSAVARLEVATAERNPS